MKKIVLIGIAGLTLGLSPSFASQIREFMAKGTGTSTYQYRNCGFGCAAKPEAMENLFNNAIESCEGRLRRVSPISYSIEEIRIGCCGLHCDPYECENQYLYTTTASATFSCSQ